MKKRNFTEKDLHCLERIHSHDDVENIKSCLDIVKSRSKEICGSKQDNLKGEKQKIEKPLEWYNYTNNQI